MARNTLIKYKLTIKLLQIYANICSESTPHTGGKLMGKHLSYAGSTRGLRILPGGGGFALCRLPSLYANAHHADAKCPAARKQETNYAREAFMKFHKENRQDSARASPQWTGTIMH